MHTQTDDDIPPTGNGPDRAHPFGDLTAQPWLDEAQRMAERAKVWAMANPFAAVGVALAAGFLVGRVARRIG